MRTTLTARLSAVRTALLLLLALLASTAQATVEFSGTSVEANRLSGENRPQQINRVGYLDDNDGYVRIIYAAERSDDPCWLRLSKYPLPGAAPRMGGPHIGFGCNNATVRSGKQVEAPDGRYITGLRICHADSQQHGRDNLMKGIEVKLARLNANNTLTQTGTDKFERTNCRSWQTWSNCPTGAVLVAVNAHVRAAGSQRNNIVGLQAICKPIRNR